MNPDQLGVPLAVVTRGDRVESRHFGAVAVALPDGRRWSRGEVDEPLWARSAIKPLQALPLVESGLAEKLGLDDRELAVICASHDGTPEHVAVVEGLLAKAGLSTAALGCGPHAPFHKKSSLQIARQGGKPQRIHNNCSGKHSGFLILARSLGAPLEGYLDFDAPGQLLVRRTVAELCGAEPDAMAVTIDGCGAPTLGLSLTELACGFRELVNPAQVDPVRQQACQRLLDAASREPFYLAGEGQLETALVRSAPGAVMPKRGAEGLFAVGLRTAEGPVGVAIKVGDGAARGYQPAVVALLGSLGLWDELPAELEQFAEVPVYNTQKRLVGSVRNALEVDGTW